MRDNYPDEFAHTLAVSGILSHMIIHHRQLCRADPRTQNIDYFHSIFE